MWFETFVMKMLSKKEETWCVMFSLMWFETFARNMYSLGSHYNYFVLCLCSLRYMYLPVQTRGDKG